MSYRIVFQKLLCRIAPQYGSSVASLRCNNIRLATTYSNVRYISNNFSNSNTKGIVPHQPLDLLLQNIRSAADTPDVLYNVNNHSKIMNELHVTQALHTIFLLQKSQVSSITNGNLVKHRSFLLLCNVLQQKVRFLELNDHLNALKVLSFVGVSSNNKTVQVLLNLVVKQVNNLTLQQIVFLDFLLKDFQSCPLVDALRIALPVVFEANFKLIRDVNDIKQLTDFFVFAVKRRLSEKCIDTFAELISQASGEIDVDNSKVIIRTLCEAKRVELPFQTLLHQCLDHVVDNITKYSALDLQFIIGRLVKNYNKRQLSYFYHEEFVNSCANYVIDNKLDEESACTVLRSCNRYKHMHKGLLDYITNIVAECPSRLEKWHDGMFVTILNGLSLSDYQPLNFDNYKNELLTNINKLQDRQKLPWFRITLDLCTLNVWSNELFNYIFNEEFLNDFLKRDNLEDALELLQLYQAATLLFPTYTGFKPSEEIIERVKIKIMQFDPKEPSPLLPALAHGVGGPTYVISNVYTKLGHYIDHAIAIRKGGYFVSINKQDQEIKDTTFIEDLKVPSDSQIVLIMYLTPYCYTLNTERMLGQVQLNLRTLEAMGYSVIPVVQSAWDNLLDSEKIPYLMQALNNKCQSQESVLASHT